MPFDLARVYFARDKSYRLSRWEGICFHSENYLSEDEQKKIIDGEYSFHVNSDSALPRSKHSYDRIFHTISCNGCMRHYYGRNIKYDTPLKCIDYFYGGDDGLDGCDCCYSRFSHNPHIRIISTSEKWRGIMTKRRMLPQRINSHVSRGSSRKNDVRRYCERKKEENAKFIKFEINDARDLCYF